MERILFFLAASLISFAAQAFTVGTQNLYHYRTRFDERVAHLQTEYRTVGSPDIMGFQEAARWVGQRDLFDDFVALTGFRGIYESTNRLGVMNDGIALVSRLPASGLQSASLPATESFSRQSINFGIFTTDAGSILIVNAHLSPNGDNGWRRVEQNKFILSVLARYPKTPAVLVGDFNDAYTSPSLKILRDAGFTDVMNGMNATYDPDHNPLVTDTRWGASRLDYILYRPSQLRVLDAGLIHTKNWVSDHYGLRATFAANPKGRTL